MRTLQRLRRQLHAPCRVYLWTASAPGRQCPLLAPPGLHRRGLVSYCWYCSSSSHLSVSRRTGGPSPADWWPPRWVPVFSSLLWSRLFGLPPRWRFSIPSWSTQPSGRNVINRWHLPPCLGLQSTRKETEVARQVTTVPTRPRRGGGTLCWGRNSTRLSCWINVRKMGFIADKLGLN